MNRFGSNSARPQPLSTQEYRVWGIVFACGTLFATFLAYSNSFSAPFVFDGSYFIRDWMSLRRLWPPRYLFELTRPFLMLTYALNYAVSKQDPLSYHVVNFAIHVLSGGLVFVVIRQAWECSIDRLTTLTDAVAAVNQSPGWWWTCSRDVEASRLRDLTAYVVATCWLLHPVQTQTVTYLHQRSEGLASFFYLATLWMFLRACAFPRRTLWYGAAAVLLTSLGHLTKEICATLPLAVLWCDRALASRSWKELFSKRWALHLCLWMTALVPASLIWLRAATYNEGGIGDTAGVSSWEYFRSQPGVIIHYLRLVVWPTNLCLDPLWPIAQASHEIVPYAVVMLVWLLAIVWLVFRNPPWGFILAFPLVVLAPTSSFIPIKDLMFENRIYLPLAGWLFVLAFGLVSFLVRKLGRESAVPTMLLCTSVIALALGSATFLRNKVHGSEIAIMLDTVQKSPNNSRAYLNLGAAYVNANMSDEAQRAFEKVLTLKTTPPKHFEHNSARNQLGKVAMRLNNFPEAERFCRRVVEDDPENAMALWTLGLARALQSDRREAIECLERAASIMEPNIELKVNLSQLYHEVGRNEDALETANQAVNLANDRAWRQDLTHMHRGKLRLDLGDLSGARSDLQISYRANPNIPQTKQFLQQVERAMKR